MLFFFSPSLFLLDSSALKVLRGVVFIIFPGVGERKLCVCFPLIFLTFICQVDVFMLPP